MKVLIVYIAVSQGDRTRFFSERFATTFLQYPPGYEFHLMTVCNGGPLLDTPLGEMLKGALFTTFYPRVNVGGDIGAYIDVAKSRGEDYDCFLCLGESVYFHRAGWLQRIAEVWCKHGPGMYGFYASKLVAKHLNTTCFAIDPKLLAIWPEVVKTREQRLAFEHGPLPMWKRVEQLGKPVRLIMWDHDQAPWEWRQRTVANEFWRGSQNQVLFKSIHTDRFDNATKATKTRWERNTDHGLKP